MEAGFLKARHVPMSAEEAMRASSKLTGIPRPRWTTLWTCEGPEQEQGVDREAHYKPWSGLGDRDAWQTHANRHPPLEPALHHRGSPMVAGEGWGQPHDPAAAEARLSPRLRVSPGDPPPLATPPHHGEVTRQWVAVGVPIVHRLPFDWETPPVMPVR